MAKEMVDKMLEELDRVKTILTNAKSSGKIPDIERDLILSKLRVIYEFMLIFQPEPDTEKKNLIGKPNDKKAVIEQPQAKEEIIEPPINKPEPLPLPVDEKKIENSVKPKANEKVEILADKLKAPSNFRNEVLARYADTFDLAKKFQHSPLANIFEAIGINEKFLFVKELFNNDAGLYKSTIEELNKAGSFNEAVEHIDKLFTWDFESSTVQKFLELVRRRHPISNE
jgi:hypothetical protein